MIRVLAALSLVACGSSSANTAQTSEGGAEPVEQPTSLLESDVEVEVEADAQPAAEHEDEDRTEEDASYESLATRLDATQPGDPITLRAAVEACPPPRGNDREARLDWFDACQLRGALAHDADGSRWVGLSVDYSEGGPEGFVLWERSGERERELIRAAVDPRDVAQLLRRVRRENQLVAAGNIAVAAATTQFSLNEYAPLVELSAPLESWRFWIETTDDLDQPEHVAWLISPAGERHEVARRVATMGPCDGNGWWCEQTGDECDEAGLRAEDRLCVLPIGIGVVAIAGEALGMTGGVQVAGHGGYPPFHWVMRLPSGVLEPG